MKKTICVGLLLSLLCMFCAGGAVSAAALTGDGSFEEETVGTISNNTEIFSKDWVEKNGQGEAASVIAEEEGNRYLNASGLLGASVRKNRRCAVYLFRRSQNGNAEGGLAGRFHQNGRCV